MRTRPVMALTACTLAGAYLISKLDLALRGKLGLPGFPADPAAYTQYDPLWGQLSNAVASLVLIAVMAVALFSVPRNRLLRWGLLAANWIALLVVALGVVTFTVRAAGWAPGLGTAAIGWQSWATVVAGYVWVGSWVGALLAATRNSPALATPVVPTADRGLSGNTPHRMGQP